jgi:Xaa-Pro aminopeptidase
MACALVAGANARTDGALEHDGAALTSERLRRIIDISLLKAGYSNPTSIVAGGPTAADCHNVGSGQLFSGQPVIIDIFPQNRVTRYYGDCTRTVVHGDVPKQVERMHATVVAAKKAATEACRAGVTGEAVHEATSGVIREHGYDLGLPPADAADSYCAMTHGTGHGIGLDVHEPPLLDKKGPELMVGDALTIEPGLYSRICGGVRVEDMVIVGENGCQSLNTIHEGLDWK